MKITVQLIPPHDFHTIEEEWERTEFACLMCAEREVYRDCGVADYYQGPQYICISCGYEWCLPNEPALCDQYDRKRVDAIKKQP